MFKFVSRKGFIAHGTKSDIFNIIPKSEFKLKNAIEILKSGYIIPCGELFRGGYIGFADPCYTSFAPIRVEENGKIKSLSIKYALMEKRCSENIPMNHSIEEIFRKSRQRSFANLKEIILILGMRYHYNGEKIFIPEDINIDLRNHLKIIRCLRQIFSRVFPKEFDISQEDSVSYLKLLKRSNEISEEPSEDDVIKLFKTLSGKETLQRSPISYRQLIGSDCPDDLYLRKIQQNVNQFTWFNIIERACERSFSAETIPRLKNFLRDYEIDFRDTCELLNDLVDGKLKFKEIEKEIDSFPILLLTDKIDRIKFSMDEYRFQRDVQIGSDIKTILVDNNTDRLKLLRYFDKYEIDCEVIVIENLFD